MTRKLQSLSHSLPAEQERRAQPLSVAARTDGFCHFSSLVGLPLHERLPCAMPVASSGTLSGLSGPKMLPSVRAGTLCPDSDQQYYDSGLQLVEGACAPDCYIRRRAD